MVEKEKVRCKAYQANVASVEEMQKVVKDVESDFGPITILVNNAGITRDKSFLKMTKTMWDALSGQSANRLYHRAGIGGERRHVHVARETGWLPARVPIWSDPPSSLFQHQTGRREAGQPDECRNRDVPHEPPLRPDESPRPARTACPARRGDALDAQPHDFRVVRARGLRGQAARDAVRALLGGCVQGDAAAPPQRPRGAVRQTRDGGRDDRRRRRERHRPARAPATAPLTRSVV